MEEEKSFAKRIYDHVEEYAKTTVELYRLKALKVFSGVFASVATGIIIWVVISFFLIFLSIGAAFYLGDLLGKWHYGFFIIAGFYALIGIVLYLVRFRYVKDQINNFIIRQIFKD